MSPHDGPSVDADSAPKSRPLGHTVRRRRRRMGSCYRAKKAELSGMERRMAALQTQVAELSGVNAQLRGNVDVLSATLESLQLLCDGSGAGSRSRAASEAETALLAQLEALPRSSDGHGVRLQANQQASASAHDASSEQPAGTAFGLEPPSACNMPEDSEPLASLRQQQQDPRHERPSPPHDPMAYLRLLLSRPPWPGASTAQLPELVADYRDTVQQLALQLHLLDRPPQHTGVTHPVAVIKQLMNRHLHRMASLVLLQRSDMMEQLMLSNFMTQELVAEHSYKRTAWVAEQLGLSQEQRDAITRGTQLFSRLLKPVTRERRELQSQFTAASAVQGSASGGSGSILVATSAAGDSGGAAADSLCGRTAAVAAQDARAARLEVLLRKEYVTRMAACAWQLGCLSWVQIAKMAVLHSPLPFRLSVLGELLTSNA